MTRHRYKPSSYTQKGRDTKVSIARRSLPLSELITDSIRRRDYRRSVLDRGVEDRRMFHPLREIRSPRSVVGGSTTLKPRFTPASKASLMPDSGLGFFAPQKVMLCVRRRVRREVLHAKKIAGGRGFRAPRFNFWSTISCKE